MTINDLKFFTNEPERDLYSRFQTILKMNTQFFDILVGYFCSSGFFRLYPAMESIEKIRILVGINLDSKTASIIDQASNKSVELTIKEAKENFSKNVIQEFEKADVVLDIEEGVRKFIEWLKCGKIEMRIYKKAPIHAKVYIMRKDQTKCDYFGSIITGSSNFSQAGLMNNLEFNVELKDKPDVEFALERFEDLWKDGVEINNEYIETINNNTWLRGDITPYEIYLKTIYEFFLEEINEDKDAFMRNFAQEGFIRLQYQIDAVVQAKKILKAYNGVFISDVVGLGKTFICSMLAKSLGLGKKLIICPPVLVNYWQDVLVEFDVAAKVISLGKLDEIEKDSEKYEYVFIDEAHRFRNAGTESFTKLHKICYDKKVVLISATPINNYSSDIENQIYLFQPKHNSNIVGVKNLEGFFARLNGDLKKFSKGTDAYNKQLRKNSEEIRDKLLRHIMIRRTRSEIMEYYKDDLKNQGLKFPKLGAPESIVYEFDEQINNIFDDTLAEIKNFSYARYKPLTYLIDPKKYASILASQQNMGGFMKGTLLKRLESSFFAFRKTLERFINSYKRFIDMYDNKKEVWISKKVDVYTLLDADEIDKLIEMEEKGEGFHFKIDEFKSSFIKDLRKDLSKLRYLYDIWKDVKVDPKFDTFCNELKSNKKFKNNKKIIFTESKETAGYLEEKLAKIYGSRVVSYSSQSSTKLKIEIEESFNPKLKERNNDLYDILITTDVLAEGVNLHRANVIINYDLPWNPTRIMQRVGRINRVGTEFDEIYVFNFFPTTTTSKHVKIKDRVLEKLQAFHDILGEDNKYLSEEEIVEPKKLFEDLTSFKDDEISTNPELKYLAVIRQIRDNDVVLFEKIKKLPKKAKTGRISDKIESDSTISFIRKGALKNFFITKNHNDTIQISFIDAIKYLECNPSEKRIDVESAYYEHYDANNVAFDDSLENDEAITANKVTIRGNDLKVYKILQAIKNEPTLTDNELNIVYRLISAYDNGDIPQNITKNIIKELGDANDVVEAFNVIKNLIPQEYLTRRQDAVLHIEGKKQVILSCFLKEKK